MEAGERFRVGGDLLLIFAEGRLHGFFQANRFGGDGVNERATLRAGESELVDFLGEGGLAKHQAATRAAQGFVRGGGDDVGVRNRAGVNASGDESGDVRHVYEEKSFDRFGNFGDTFEIDDAGIGAGAGDDHFRFVLVGQLFDFVVVDALVSLRTCMR